MCTAQHTLSVSRALDDLQDSGLYVESHCMSSTLKDHTKCLDIYPVMMTSINKPPRMASPSVQSKFRRTVFRACVALLTRTVSSSCAPMRSATSRLYQ